MTVSGQEPKVTSGFAGLRVLALESRRAPELSKLISSYGGLPIVAPAMRELPLESNSEALAFAARLFVGEFDIVIFLTGVGARTLLGVVETTYKRDEYVAALQQIKIVARGPKPIAALREIGITPALVVPEPNTWRELLGALDDAGQSAAGIRLNGARVAVQEYGVCNPELLDGLEKRGAQVTRVPVYQWALPNDLAPLRAAIQSLAEGKIDVVIFTTSVQAVHLFQVAAAMNLEKEMRAGLERAMVASIGPTTSEELSRQRIRVDLEPSHPKMGFLVKEAAERAAEFIRRRPEESAST
jgi:uroporphyrinogen-III synthase